MTPHEKMTEIIADILAPKDKHSEAGRAYAEALADKIISAIYAELQNITEAMEKAASKEDEFASIHNMGAPPTSEAIWQAMLAASPLNPEAKP